jgi:beta-lactamase class A
MKELLRTKLWPIRPIQYNLTILFTLTANASCFLYCPESLAQVQTLAPILPMAAIDRLFVATTIELSWFAPSFLEQIPPTQINQIIAQLKAALGEYKGVRPEGKEYLVLFSRGTVPTAIALNAQGQISGLLFRPARSAAATLDEAVGALVGLPGKVALLVIEDGKTLVAKNHEVPLAVGSAFKLAVLAALQRQIREGKHSYHEVVELKPLWKSLPSGILQDWPDGAPLTLGTLATLMISKSDNTATDALIAVVGTQAVERESLRNRPFLTTRSAFVLKSDANKALLERYRSAAEEQKREVLRKTLELPLPSATEFGSELKAPDVEWFFTAEELCSLMEQMKEVPALAINPGPAGHGDWQKVAFKGGSEAGVINLTTRLQAKNGRRYCVSATWNGDEVGV